MAYYYKINNSEPSIDGIQVYETDTAPLPTVPSTKFDFSKHVLIELLDNVTPEAKLWEELGLTSNRHVVHKRLMVDSHRVHCRRAIVVCENSEEAKSLAQRLSQTKIMRRCVCAVVVQELLTDLSLFEKQIRQFDDKRSQEQLLYVTDLNCYQEPAGLAHYLREKFSPFGTIVSIFVAEGEKGYAYPEGVIKFSHLSEAFAAELAYDQYVVGMERLSVTTHHNILLSQCDLRVRLREAQMRNNDSRNGQSPSNMNSDDSIVSNGAYSYSQAYRSTINCSTPRRGSADCYNNTGHFSSDSAELADALQNSCQVNLVECLKGITMCSDSSVSKETVDDTISESNLADISDNVQSNSKHLAACSIKSSITTLPLKEQSWSSRVLGWMTDFPNSDILHADSKKLPNGNASLSLTGDLQTTLRLTSHKLHSAESLKTPLDVASVSSFVTCNTVPEAMDDSSSSEKTLLNNSNSCNEQNNTILNMPDSASPGRTHSPNNIFGAEKAMSEKSSCISVNCELAPTYNSLSAHSSQKRKNTSSLSNKLSLKSQRLDSSQSLSSGISNCESTLILPTSCGVDPTLNAVHKVGVHSVSSSVTKFPRVYLTRLSPSEINTLCSQSKVNSHFTVHKFQRGRSVDSNCNNVELAFPSKNTRRSSRLASRQSDSNSRCQSPHSLNKESLPESAALLDRDKITAVDSPLRTWLKNELLLSNNNRMSNSGENSRKVVCATVKRDVLVSVGCSYMSCEFCYPGSTNLLLGIY